MRGRKQKPTELKILEGNPGKRSGSLEKDASRLVSDLPEVPDHLDDIAKGEWERLASGMNNLGILDEVDRSQFAAYCVSYSIWVRATKALNAAAQLDPEEGGLVIKTKNGNAIQDPLVGIANTAARDMLKFAEQFGLTPSARARLGITLGKKKQSKFEGLIGGKAKK